MDIDHNISQKYCCTRSLETSAVRKIWRCGGGGGWRLEICSYRDIGNDNNNIRLQELDLEKIPPVIQKCVNRVGIEIITIKI
jgi:hypothetical protein